MKFTSPTFYTVYFSRSTETVISFVLLRQTPCPAALCCVRLRVLRRSCILYTLRSSALVFLVLPASDSFACVRDKLGSTARLHRSRMLLRFEQLLHIITLSAFCQPYFLRSFNPSILNLSITMSFRGAKRRGNLVLRWYEIAALSLAMTNYELKFMAAEVSFNRRPTAFTLYHLPPCFFNPRYLSFASLY